MRVLVRRPKLARVERLDGTLLKVLREPPQPVPPPSRRWDAQPTPRPGAADLDMEVDADGLVRRRPPWTRSEVDTPMIRNYYDVAMLDPVELADGDDGGPGATVDGLRVVDHHGRAAWEAVLRPTPAYEPRCTCCSLLLTDKMEEIGMSLRANDPDFVYPEAHRVRLDVRTGVCVRVEQLDGTRAGSGHDLTIEAVDEPMGDELFPHLPHTW